MNDRPSPPGGRARRTLENRRRYGSMEERAERVLQILYLADGPTAAREICDALDWPNGLTGGVLTYLRQRGKAVRVSGGSRGWKLTEREYQRQQRMREPRG